MAEPLRRTRIAVYALLKQEERMLFCRIAPSVVLHAGMWTLPGGGIEFGESPESALKREVEEEAGLTVEPMRIAKVDSELVVLEDEPIHVIRLLFHARIIGGILRDEIGGSTDCARWMTRAEAETTQLVPIAQIGVRCAFDGP